jgi:hypothetical protein
MQLVEIFVSKMMLLSGDWSSANFGNGVCVIYSWNCLVKATLQFTSLYTCSQFGHLRVHGTKCTDGFELWFTSLCEQGSSLKLTCIICPKCNTTGLNLSQWVSQSLNFREQVSYGLVRLLKNPLIVCTTNCWASDKINYEERLAVQSKRKNVPLGYIPANYTYKSHASSVYYVSRFIHNTASY